MGIGPSILRGRIRTTTWLYEDPDHPDRVTGTLESPAFTEEDRCLLLALDAYEGSLCPGCDQPIALAWHSELDGWFETDQYVCHACTSRLEDPSKPTAYTLVRNTMPADRLADLPTFVLGETTSSP
jgi:hypothetical protein